MITVTLKDGTTIQAYLFFYHSGTPQIHIYPSDLSIADIYKLFDNPEYTETITVVSDEMNPETEEVEQKTSVYTGYTELFAVQRSTYHPTEKEYMIWLQKPENSYR